MDYKSDVILEYLAPLASVPSDVAQLKTDINEVKTRLTTIEFAVTDLSKQRGQIENRVTKLEQPT